MLKLKKGDSFMPQGKTAARNNWIELLRFLFALLIPLYHGRFLPPETSWFRAPNGAVAVEFFFILTGFLMAGSVKKRLNFWFRPWSKKKQIKELPITIQS